MFLLSLRPGMAGSRTTVPDVGAQDPLQAFDAMKMLSPSEMDFAFVAAAYRDKDDAEKMEEWRTLGFCLS